MASTGASDALLLANRAAFALGYHSLRHMGTGRQGSALATALAEVSGRRGKLGYSQGLPTLCSNAAEHFEDVEHFVLFKIVRRISENRWK